MYALKEYSELGIRRLARGNWVRLVCLKPTADFYGWSTVFPEIWDAESVDYPDGMRPWPTRTSPFRKVGKRLRICRAHGNKQGWPAGKTNCFRVTNNCRQMDLVAIAQAVQISYGWMENFNHNRLSMEHWESIDIPDRYCYQDLRAAESIA